MPPLGQIAYALTAYGLHAVRRGSTRALRRLQTRRAARPRLRGRHPAPR